MAGEDDLNSMDRGDNFTPSMDDSSDELSVDSHDSGKVEAQDAAVDKGEQAADDKTEQTEQTEQVRDEKGRFIPKARFDEAVTKEREKREAAERQLQELQKQMQAVSRTADATKLEDQLKEVRKAERKAIMDGDEEKSTELAAQADRINRQIMIAESQTMSNQAGEEAREGIRVEMAIEKLEGIYPALKEGSEAFDQGLVDLVLAQQQQLMSRDRMPPSQALTKAANDIMSRFQPPAKADEKPAGGLKDAKGADRAAQSKQKNIDAAMKTPPDTRDVGVDTDKAGMRDGMPQPSNVDDLKAIPEATLKRMRGDLV
jgi:hypothetical protein